MMTMMTEDEEGREQCDVMDVSARIQSEEMPQGTPSVTFCADSDGCTGNATDSPNSPVCGRLSQKREISFKRKMMQLVTHSKTDHGKRLEDFLRTLKCSGYSKLSENCGLSITELEEMAARQARQLETQEQLLAAKAQRLRYLKSGGEAERLMRLREKVATQEERLRKLRALRGKVQSNKNGNSVLSSDLESLRAVFNEKEKELSVAVAKVDELTRQLEDLRRGNGTTVKDGNGTLSNHSPTNGQSSASIELDKLRRELMYRQKLREAQASRVADQRAKLSQRQEEANRVDRRIAELQERLHRKRFLNHQLAATLKQQENVEDYLENGVPTKNDSKYQTLPYNAKFTPFGVKQLTPNYQEPPPIQNQNQKHVQDQVAKFDKAIQQMQIITLDHHHQHQQPQLNSGINNKLMNSFGTNFHQVLTQQNHGSTKSANPGVTNSNTESQTRQSPVLTNGIGHGHGTGTGHGFLPKGKSMSTISGTHEAENSVGCPVVRNSNYLPTGAPHNVDSNGTIFHSQSGTTRDVTSSGGSNGSISGSSSDGVVGHNYTNSDGKNPRPALPPKPSKPAPPSRQISDGDAFSYIQRSLSTGDGMGMIPDRTELPIKPKPLYLEKTSSTSSFERNEAIATSVPPLLPPSGPTTSVRHPDREAATAPNGTTTNSKSNNATVRVSMNRRIEMPPAFLFPESDPPPSDLVPEQYSSSATSSLSSTSLTSSVSSGGLDSRNSGESNDTVDASPLTLQTHQRPSHHGIEEYTLPDLLPNMSSSPSALFNGGENTFRQQPPLHSNNNNVKLHSPNNNTNHQFPSTMTTVSTSGLTLQENNKTNCSNNNYQDTSTVLHQQAKLHVATSTPSPIDKIMYDSSNGNGQQQERHFEQQQVSVMSLQLDPRTSSLAFENELSKSKQRESPDAVIEAENQSRSEQTFDYDNGNVENGNMASTESTTEYNGNTEESNKHTHMGIIKRLKKGNLKSANKESSPNGRRVSFDPLALLLDASLEGELELVMKTAKEVGNPSAANDEGITALHNAICAGHADVVRFLVEFGCDVNAQDSDGWTPLHCAASCNNTGMVKFLVEHGACIFATTLSDHETAAEKCEEDEDGFGPCSEYLYSVQEKLGITNNGVVYAVFDYEAQNSDELTFQTGKRLTVLRKGDEVEREWWWSSSGDNEAQGYIPRNLLGLYPRVLPTEKRKVEC